MRPDFIALTLIYWVVYHPRRVGFLPAWLLGLTMDVADGSLFGQHALAYAVMMYLAILLHRRIVMFGMRHQSPACAGDSGRVSADHAGRAHDGRRRVSRARCISSPASSARCCGPLLFSLIRIPLRPRADPDAV